jgi:hypothetical protein
MIQVHELLRQYIEEHRSGAEADPRTFLERVEGLDRRELEALIDEYLRSAPRREWDAAGYRSSAAPAVVESLARSLEGEGGLWPALLPRLRGRARIRRVDLVAELAARLGAQSEQEKVASYYHEMEQGLLPAEGVSDTVLEALGKIVGQSAEALRQAGRALRPGPGAGEQAAPAFRRSSSVKPEYEASTQDGVGAVAEARSAEEWDEVDRLFRGGN